MWKRQTYTWLKKIKSYSLRIFVSSLTFFLFLSRGQAEVPSHPLDPLTKEELEQALRILKGSEKLPEGSLFPTVALNEPPKDEVVSYRSGAPFRREALATVFDRAHSRTVEAVVDLRARKIISWKEIPGVQPAISVEELNLVPTIVRKDLRWQEAIRKRGISAFEDVMVDPWAPGTLSPEEDPGVRWIRALSYIKGKSKNGYARPIEGIVAVVNMNEKKVARVLDTGVRPLPPQSNDLDMKAIGKQRMAPRPLLVSQPQGSSFEVNGHEVRWQKWRFRFAVHPREGLVLYSVGYEDQGRVRSVLYRAAISEMVVPYGDKAENWVFRNAFDEGEYGIGKLTDEMVVGADAPKHARFFDFVYLDDTGKMNTTSRAVALYERDGGLLWKHFEFYSNSNDSRRSRELVLSSILSVGNYDYGVNWIFRQDGSLELQGMLTGIMLAKGVPYARIEDHHEDPFAHLVAPYVAAPHHQHFFNFRLDFDVEGSGPNSVSEVNVRPLPVGDGNPHANAFVMDETVFRTEQEARRELNLESARKWIVTNPIVKNSLGHSAGYALVPGESGVPYVHPESKVRQRAGFIDHHLWVTPYEPLERHAAGEYPNQAREPDGLAKWTKQNRSIENRDVVVWYTFAVTHIPRPEEWPVMSVTTAGFKLLPVGFFSRNPALDVPK